MVSGTWYTSCDVEAKMSFSHKRNVQRVGQIMMQTIHSRSKPAGYALRDLFGTNRAQATPSYIAQIVRLPHGTVSRIDQTSNWSVLRFLGDDAGVGGLSDL